jgi:hypothetical protein
MIHRKVQGVLHTQNTNTEQKSNNCSQIQKTTQKTIMVNTRTTNFLPFDVESQDVPALLRLEDFYSSDEESTINPADSDMEIDEEEDETMNDANNENELEGNMYAQLEDGFRTPEHYITMNRDEDDNIIPPPPAPMRRHFETFPTDEELGLNLLDLDNYMNLQPVNLNYYF